jgi:hypothetical protein
VQEYATAAATVNELTAFLLFHLKKIKKISQYCESRLNFAKRNKWSFIAVHTMGKYLTERISM